MENGKRKKYFEFPEFSLQLTENQGSGQFVNQDTRKGFIFPYGGFKVEGGKSKVDKLMKSGFGDYIVEADAKTDTYFDTHPRLFKKKGWIGNPAVRGFMNQPSGNQMYNTIFDNDVKWKSHIPEGQESVHFIVCRTIAPLKKGEQLLVWYDCDLAFCAKRGYLPAIPSHQ